MSIRLTPRGRASGPRALVARHLRADAPAAEPRRARDATSCSSSSAGSPRARSRCAAPPTCSRRSAPEERRRGVVAASAGQPRARRRLRGGARSAGTLRATLFVPTTAPRAKVDKLRRFPVDGARDGRDLRRRGRGGAGLRARDGRDLRPRLRGRAHGRRPGHARRSRSSTSAPSVAAVLVPVGGGGPDRRHRRRRVKARAPGVRDRRRAAGGLPVARASRCASGRPLLTYPAGPTLADGLAGRHRRDRLRPPRPRGRGRHRERGRDRGRDRGAPRRRPGGGRGLRAPSVSPRCARARSRAPRAGRSWRWSRAATSTRGCCARLLARAPGRRPRRREGRAAARPALRARGRPGARPGLARPSARWRAAGPGRAPALAAGARARPRGAPLLGRRTARRRAALALPFPGEVARLPARPLRPLRAAGRRLARAASRTTCGSSWPRSASRGSGSRSTDELRLLVAASAVTLSVGWPDYEWDQLTEVLLYPDDFDRDYAFGGDERSGRGPPLGHGDPLGARRSSRASRCPTTPTTSGSTSSRTSSTWTRPTSTASRSASTASGPASGWRWPRRRWSGCGTARSAFDEYGAHDAGRVPGGGGGGVLRDPAGGAPPPPRGVRDTLVVLRPGPRGLGRRAGSPGVAMRLDLLLIRRHPGLSRRKAREVIEKGQVSVDGASVREAGREVPESANVVFDPNRKALPRARCTLGVLYEDEHVIVVDKPAGLLTVPSAPGVHDEDTALAPRAGLRPAPEAARGLRRARPPPRPGHVGRDRVRPLARGARGAHPHLPRPPDRAALPRDRGGRAPGREGNGGGAAARGVGRAAAAGWRSRARRRATPARTGACASACPGRRSWRSSSRPADSTRSASTSRTWACRSWGTRCTAAPPPAGPSRAGPCSTRSGWPSATRSRASASRPRARCPTDFQKALAALRRRRRARPDEARAARRAAISPAAARGIWGARRVPQDQLRTDRISRRPIGESSKCTPTWNDRPSSRAQIAVPGTSTDGGSRAVLDRGLEDDRDRGAAIDVLPHPQPAAVGREVHRRGGTPVAVRAIADGQQAGPPGRDAPVVPARNCSFTHDFTWKKSTRERRDAGV